MALHLIKLCVGADSIDDLRHWLREAKRGRDTLDHTTRMFPKRRDEIVRGGSLYWVIKGLVLCRQPIADLVPVRGDDGIDRCRIDFKAKIVPVRPTPRRAFQGWRYLEDADAPPDLAKAQQGPVSMPDNLRRELAELGLL
jgi:hypothetical protein